MGSFDLSRFEAEAEALAQARSARYLGWLRGERGSLDLRQLYGQDFPNFQSADLYADLREAAVEDEQRRRFDLAFLAAAEAEARTAALSDRLLSLQPAARIQIGGRDRPWSEGPARWAVEPDPDTRRALYESWGATLERDLNPVLRRWLDGLGAVAAELGETDWLGWWDAQAPFPRESHAPGVTLPRVDEPHQEAWTNRPLTPATELARLLLDRTDTTYRQGLRAYFAVLDLTLGQASVADADWAFRASHLAEHFPADDAMPIVVRTLRGLGLELQEQPSLHLAPGVAGSRGTPLTCVVRNVPREVHVLGNMAAGWQGFHGLLATIGQAQHAVWTDPTLPFPYRWAGDETATLGYGLLLADLLLDPVWLRERLAFSESRDFVLIASLARLYRLRRAAAGWLYEQRLWTDEPGGSLANDYAETLTDVLEVRHSPEEFLLGVLRGPWGALEPAVAIRAEVFAAQVRSYLLREFDEEWWRNPRAGRFLRQELWQAGRRYTAEQIAGFMGYAELDASALLSEVVGVLATA